MIPKHRTEAILKTNHNQNIQLPECKSTWRKLGQYEQLSDLFLLLELAVIASMTKHLDMLSFNKLSMPGRFSVNFRQYSLEA